jgi:PAS domain-containing protein
MTRERSHTRPPEMAFREALEARSFWREAVLSDPELGFLMLDQDGAILSANDNAADILLGLTADLLVGRRLGDLLPQEMVRERMDFVSYVLSAERSLLATSLFRGVRCRCILRRLPGDAGEAGHVLWTIRRAPIPWQPTDLHAMIDVVDARELDWGPLEVLSEDERRAFALLAAGVPLEDASQRLASSVEALLEARDEIHAKLGTACPARLAQLAVAAGLVEVPQLVLDRC